MAQMVEDWYKQMPIITRSYLTLSVLTSAGCALEILISINAFREGASVYCLYGLLHLLVISYFQLYLNPTLVIKQYEVWRLFTNFFYFGGLDLDFLFHMFFLARYCKLLEDTSFRGRTADFFFMLLFGASLLTVMVVGGCALPWFSQNFAKVFFLSNSLTFMMVYVWSKRNPHVQMSFLGLFSFTAPYLPWVLLGFSIMVGSNSWVDLLGMAAGHAYYFLEDVYPLMTGRRILKTPGIIKVLFPEEDVVVARPLGQAWRAQHID